MLPAAFVRVRRRAARRIEINGLLPRRRAAIDAVELRSADAAPRQRDRPRRSHRRRDLGRADRRRGPRAGLHQRGDPEVVRPGRQRASRRGARARRGRGRENVLLPAGRLEQVIAANLDVGRNQIGDGRTGAAEHDVLGARLEVVVDDVERTRAVVSRERLGIRRNGLDVRDVTVQNRDRPAVERNPALLPLVAVPVHVHPVHHDVVGDGGVGLVVAEQDHRFVPLVGRPVDLQELQPVVVRAPRGAEHRSRPVGAALPEQPRQQRPRRIRPAPVRRNEAHPVGRELRICGIGSDGDKGGAAALRGKREIADEGLTGPEQDGISG